ncbi:MAG TPA: type II toxin-antitoxin system Phd/YefM family antitoxin [Candidatus Deferrimicrobiaceae bacterium]|jgi:prevent-host-death family protein
MKIVSTVKARETFSEVVNRAAFGKERVVLTRHGKGLAAVVPIEDLRLLEAIEDEQDIRDARKAQREIAKKGTVPFADVKKELGL